MADAADFFQILVGQDRLAHFQPLLLGRAVVVENIRARADEGHEAHDQFLADRVDRRIGHLREVLFEVSVEQVLAIGERRDRRIRAHRAHRLLAGDGHRQDQQVQIFLRVAKGLLAVEQGHVGARGARLNRLQILEHDLRARQPFAIGVRGGQRRLDLVVRNDATLLQIDQQHLAGLKPPFGDDFFLRNRQNAHFRRHDHEAVVGDEIARRPQAVAVQRRADLAPVGEGHRRRAVPWLHQGGVIFVKRLAMRVHQRIAGPRLGDQHHDGVSQRIAPAHQKFERIVETGGVGLPFVGDRPYLPDVVAKQRRGHRRLARGHPIQIAAQRVDLAVVRDEAIGVREAPGREGVGGETLVHQRQRGNESRVLQIEEIFPELLDEHHALIDDCARRERNGIMLAAQGPERVNLVRRGLAREVETPLEIGVVLDARAASDEDLSVERLDLAHGVAKIAGIDRQVAPAQHRQPLGLDRGFNESERLGAGFEVARQKKLADRVFSGLRQNDAQFFGLLREKFVRNLDKNAAAVAKLRIGADGAAMIQIEQDLKAHLDDVVAGRVMQIGDEADAAGIMFLGGIVKALRLRRQGIATLHGDIFRARADLILIFCSRHIFVPRPKHILAHRLRQPLAGTAHPPLSTKARAGSSAHAPWQEPRHRACLYFFGSLDRGAPGEKCRRDHQCRIEGANWNLRACLPEWSARLTIRGDILARFADATQASRDRPKFGPFRRAKARVPSNPAANGLRRARLHPSRVTRGAKPAGS